MIEQVNITSAVTISAASESMVTQLINDESMISLTSSSDSMVTIVYPITSKTGLESA